MTNTTTTTTHFRVIATLENGREVTLHRSADLGRLIERLGTSGAFERFDARYGIDYLTLEDDSLGFRLWTETLPEAVRGMRIRGEITAKTEKLARACFLND